MTDDRDDLPFDDESDFSPINSPIDIYMMDLLYKNKDDRLVLQVNVDYDIYAGLSEFKPAEPRPLYKVKNKKSGVTEVEMTVLYRAIIYAHILHHELTRVTEEIRVTENDSAALVKFAAEEGVDEKAASFYQDMLEKLEKNDKPN